MGGRRKLGSCCLCVPLEPGVGILCVLFFLVGLWDFITLFIDDIRLQFNGYNRMVRHLEVFTGMFYLVFALIGFIGLLDARLQYVKYFKNFIILHCFVYVTVFLFDYWALYYQCGKQATNEVSYENFLVPLKNDYNMSIELIQKKGLCDWVRRSYVIGAFISFGVRLYFLRAIRIYVMRAEKAVPFSISFSNAKHIPGNESLVVDMGGEHPGMYFEEEKEAYDTYLEKIEKQRNAILKHYGATS